MQFSGNNPGHHLFPVDSRFRQWSLQRPHLDGGDDVNAAMRKHINPKRLRIVIAGDFEKSAEE